MVSKGIAQVLNKSLMNVKLLFGVTRDGKNSKNFQLKYDYIKNSASFIKSKKTEEIWSFYECWYVIEWN